MSDTEKSKNSSRWWEYYVVRYFIGTIVGAGAILMFNEESASPLKGALFPAISSFKDAGIHHLLVLIALGLAYCYIASAPILTIHSLRAQIEFDGKRCLSSSSAWLVAFFTVLIASAYLFLSLPLLSWRFFAIIFVCLILALQLTLFVEAKRNGFDKITSYYWSLSTARASASPQVQEYVESYRHLREHGNAFAIIIFELGFAMAAIAVPSLSMLAILLLLWVIPAAAVWMVGTILEMKLANAPK